MAAPPPLADPVVAAVCRHPRPGEILWRIAIIGAIAWLYRELTHGFVHLGHGRFFCSFLLVPQLFGAIRALLGFARRDRRLPGPFGFLDVLVVNEVRRVVRSLRAAFQVRATKVTGKIREWDGGDGPMILITDDGREVWVDAGLTHTRIFTPDMPALGDRVQVLGEPAADQDQGAFRGAYRHRLEAPITIIDPTWQPFPWIVADAALAGLAVLGYVAVFVTTLL